MGDLTWIAVHGLIGPFFDAPDGGLAAEPLRPRTRVLAPALRGYGERRSDPPEQIDLEAQADLIAESIEQVPGDGGVVVAGHSVGGVVAALAARRQLQRVVALVSIEGNFTMADAFWSSQVARQTAEEVAAALEADRADPAGWLERAGVRPSPQRLQRAQAALRFQPSATLQAMARSVVSTTGSPDYEVRLREVFDALPVHLVAGERSRAGWDVPGWALHAAASYTEISGVGHMMALEEPARFGRALAALLP